MSSTATAHKTTSRISTKAGSSHSRRPQSRTKTSSNAFVNFVSAYPRIMIPLIVLAIIVVGYFAVDIVASFGKIHPGVRVQGVDVGGMTREDASAKLTESLTPKIENARITLYENNSIATADGAGSSQGGSAESGHSEETAGADVNGDGVTDKWTITSDTIGAYINGNELANQAYAVGREGNVVAERFGAWFGGKDLTANVSVSDERYNTLVSEINETIGDPIVDSNISINNGVASAVPGKDGLSVDKNQFIANYSQAAFKSSDNYCIIPMKIDKMHITADTAKSLAEYTTKAIEQDVTITYNTSSWTLTKNELGNLLSTSVLEPGTVLVFGNGTQKTEKESDETVSVYDVSAGTDSQSKYVLQSYIDQAKMDAYLVQILGDAAMGGAVDASFDTSSGEVVIVESIEGHGPDRAAAAVATQDLVFGTQDGTLSNRTISLVDTTIQPNFTTEMARSMGITQRLATWTIPLSGTSERIHNIRLLCDLINNSLVAPGATWSFNGRTGERTAEKGFETAPVIINGKHEDQLGGGICQVATCVYNCACFSGLDIVNRTNHDFYIESYDEDGFADATVSWDTPDFAFANDMKTYVLITADAYGDDVVVSFWGTNDGRKVDCQRGQWKEGDKYKTVHETDATLPAGTSKKIQSGQDGRSIDIRYLCTAADGTVLHDVTFHSNYSPQNEIIADGPAVAQPSQDTQGSASSASTGASEP